MRVYDNGAYRDMTAEELAAYEAAKQSPEPFPEPTLEEQMAELREAFDMILAGVTE